MGRHHLAQGLVDVLAPDVVFLADGQIVTELREPTPERILETMKSLDPKLQG